MALRMGPCRIRHAGWGLAMARFTSPRLNALWTVGFWMYGRPPTVYEFHCLHHAIYKEDRHASAD